MPPCTQVELLYSSLLAGELLLAIATSITMVNTCFVSALIVAAQVGGAHAFSSKVTAFVHQSPSTSTSRALDSSLFSSPTSDNDAQSTNDNNGAVQKRRAFLANFAATSLLPLLTVANPSAASARFAINEKGPLVYGNDDIMSQKEHGTTSIPVQENLRYGVSSLV